ncbi:MAG: glycosyltransferase family 4 protein [Planctomycetaceae bacterium]
MKVLHLNDHLSWSGGIETYLLSLIPLLESLGHPQVVAYAMGDGRLVRSSRQLPCLASAGRAARRTAHRHMTDLLAAERPDVVHVHNIHNLGAIAACLDKVPTILHGHDYRYLCPASTFFFRRTESICERTCGPGCFAATLGAHCMSLRPPYVWSYYQNVRRVAALSGRFAGVLANSGYMRERFVRGGFPPRRTVVLPYFCPLEPASVERQAPGNPTIVFVGRARRNKGYRHFVEALALLPAEVRGLMVGDFSDAAAAEVRSVAEAGGCLGRLELIPWASHDRMREIYARATVAVVPSIWAEPLGIVGLEALACGVPVVASDVGGVREWLHEGVTGRLAPAGDSVALANCIADVLNRPDLGRALGENGRQLVRSKFSPQQHLDDLLACYESSLATQSERARTLKRNAFDEETAIVEKGHSQKSNQTTV